jgi:UDP-N-acetylglucosamine 4,6-dehydratase
MILSLLQRTQPLLELDLALHKTHLQEQVEQASFLVLGGAGSIGQAVTKEIFKRSPKKLHVVDISENNLVELVRDIRSSYGYIKGDFKTFALDIGSKVYDAFIENDGQYDYVLNLSALKHVRSEKDPFTLMRMIEVNILNTLKTCLQSQAKGVKKYFCVSTDKAANPVNMMGASKRIMELFLMREANHLPISTARFANVAFSDGSLLYGFQNRIIKKQPIAAPDDVKRYFITQEEAGQLCLISCLMGENKDIFFPKLKDELHLITFKSIAQKFLLDQGFTPMECSSEEEARSTIEKCIEDKKWPCYFSSSNTTGEKSFEEFYREDEQLDLERFENLGIVKSELNAAAEQLDLFLGKVNEMRTNNHWEKEEIVTLFQSLLPEFNHIETLRSLDQKM